MSSQGPGSNPVVVVIMEVVVISSQSIEPTVHSISNYSGVHIRWGNHCVSGTIAQILNEPLRVQKQTIAHLKAQNFKFHILQIYFLVRIGIGVVAL